MKPCRLAAENLACRRGDRVLFAGLSLDLNSGEALHVTGPNGTGKSSLMRILAGLLHAYDGIVTRTAAIALLDEKPALDEHLPLGKALGFWGRLDSGAAELASSGLDELADVPVRYLSTGQRKRAALARLLGQNAPIWLLDEPLNGLDTRGVALVERLIGDHRSAGGIVVIASHQPIGVDAAHALDIRDFAA